MKIQPPSALAGAGLLALTLVAASAVQHPRPVPEEPVDVADDVRVAGIPDPRHQIVIREEDGPRKVPAGKLFVLTALGATTHGRVAKLYVNDDLELTRAYHDHEGLSVVPVPPGFTAVSGDVLKVRAEGVGRAWGYLVDS